MATGLRRRLARLMDRTTPAPGPGEQADDRADAPVPPALSVVIPVYDTAAFLGECLDSLLEQSFDDFEVIAVDDGSTDASPAILADYAARDARFRVLTQPNAGQGAARNLGVQHASGDFLTFVDSDDLVPPDAFRRQIDVLRRTGSDFCVGAVRRRGRSAPWWSPVVHARTLLGTSIEEFPEAMLDVIACNRMFRTAFWVDRVGGFPVAMAYEDHVPMVRAYVRARSFDVLRRPTYIWRYRDDRGSTSQGKADLGNLHDRLRAKKEAGALLAAEAAGPVRSAWTARVLDADLPLFINAALRGDEEYRRTLATALRGFVDAADDTVWRQVRFHQKLRSWLAADEDWAALERLEAWFRVWTRTPPTAVVGDRVVCTAELDTVLGRPVPAELTAFSVHQTPLVVEVGRITTTPETMTIAGVAWIEGVQPRAAPTLRVHLLGPDEQRIPVPVRLEPDDPALATQAARSATVGSDHAAGAFRAVVDLTGPAHRPGVWRLEFTLLAEGLRRSGHALRRVVDSAADRACLRAARIDVDAAGDGGGMDGAGVRVAPRWDDADGLVIDVVEDEVTVHDLDLSAGTLHGRLRSVHELRRVVASRAGGPAPVAEQLRADADGWLFDLALPDVEPGAPWRLRAVTAEGRRIPLGWDGHAVAGSDGTRALHRTARGNAEVQTAPAAVEIAAVLAGADHTEHADADRPDADHTGTDHTGTDRLDAVLAGSGPPPELVLLPDLPSPDPFQDAAPHAAVDTATDTATDLRSPATTSGDPAAPRPVPVRCVDGTWVADLAAPGVDGALGSGRWHLATATGAPVRWLAESLPPEEHLGSRHRYRLLRGRGDEVVLVAEPPLLLDELGRAAQQSLRQECAATARDEPTAALVLVHLGGHPAGSAGGPVTDPAADPPLAASLAELLRASEALGTLCWTVRTPAAPVLPGDRSVLVTSRAWYRLLATSTVLCLAEDPGPWFSPNPRQRVLRLLLEAAEETEPIGRSAWERRGHTPGRIADELAWAARWDAVLLPPGADPDRVRHEFDYAGPILTLPTG